MNNKGFVRIFEAVIASIIMILVFSYLVVSQDFNYNVGLEFIGYNSLYSANIEESDFENIGSLYEKIKLPSNVGYGFEIYKNGNLSYCDAKKGVIVERNFIFENNSSVNFYKLRLKLWWR
ncbi:hypothetical protein [Methanocaldococcus fervens]|uniref:Uncharacterized protein n=1 Tax=Methanocaldococcus fervens (strain DSM 4213 / JCM 15782 / AG86) TaxID=573064 RepID=C7P5U7_METFA|nr:hypothetical protein [Methanocaldococcus fervens]ACV23929.1 hypothetical protein Mefer_0087 [Methanocaldococcus fervens AG86]